MVKKQNKAGLGRGLDALFGDMNLDPVTEVSVEEVETVGDNEQVVEVQIADIRPNPYQPRKFFNEVSLKELADSIAISGVIQPIILRKSQIKGYEIIAGERRVRASEIAGKEVVPAIVRDFTEQEMIEVAILENLQRENLNPIEEAQAYETFMKQLHLTQEEVAVRLGKSRSYIANYLRLLDLPSEVKQMVVDGLLTAGHGRTLLAIKNTQALLSLAKETIQKHYSVRELEALVNEYNQPHRESSKRRRIRQDKPAYIRESEDLLMDKFGTTVSINNKGDKGAIQIEYLSQDDLTRILDILDVTIED